MEDNRTLMLKPDFEEQIQAIETLEACLLGRYCSDANTSKALRASNHPLERIIMDLTPSEIENSGLPFKKARL